MDKYGTIVADPPWQFSTSGPVGNGGRGKRGAEKIVQISVKEQYETMTAEQIARLPISHLAARNSHLYLWVPNAFMVEGHDICRAWGFKPKTIITWTKIKADGTPSMKAGHWYRGATEHCIFAVRGRLPLSITKGVPNAYLHPRLSRHSEKPEAFIRDIVERCSPGPYLELFSRRKRPGWSHMGNEIAYDVDADVSIGQYFYATPRGGAIFANCALT
jgi:N6-adenosine-specific RNA methylase IME4